MDIATFAGRQKGVTNSAGKITLTLSLFVVTPEISHGRLISGSIH